MKSKNKRLLEALEELLKHIEWAGKAKTNPVFWKKRDGSRGEYPEIAISRKAIAEAIKGGM